MLEPRGQRSNRNPTYIIYIKQKSEGKGKKTKAKTRLEQKGNKTYPYPTLKSQLTKDHFEGNSIKSDQ